MEKIKTKPGKNPIPVRVKDRDGTVRYFKSLSDMYRYYDENDPNGMRYQTLINYIKKAKVDPSGEAEMRGREIKILDKKFNLNSEETHFLKIGQYE